MITYVGALVQTFPTGYPLPVQMAYQGPASDMRLQFQTFGCLNMGRCGYTVHFVQPGAAAPPHFVPPRVITNWVVPPPMQLTTADGTIQGKVDGVNTTFTFAIYLHRALIYRNGILQTQNVDVAFGGTAIKFLPGSIPQPGDLITISGQVQG